MKNVIIIGGGASGMIAALSAAENSSNHVTLLERQSRVGRKLLSTGNGRCNITNTSASPSCYRGADPSFAETAISSFSPQDTIAYFYSLGLVLSEQYGGRVYPLSDSASSVVDVLRFSLEKAGVNLITDCCVKGASKGKSGFSVFTDTDCYSSDALIIACGGKAGGKLGATGDGYSILKSFGHSCTKIYPSLVPITTDSDYPRSLKGIRTDAVLKLTSGGDFLAEGKGELQFTEKGISGPAAFDISREASVHGGEVSIDLLSSMSEKEILTLLKNRADAFPDLEIQNIFIGILHTRLGTVLAKYCHLRPSDRCSVLTGRDLAQLAGAAKNFILPVKGTGDFDAAQVTVGGIRTTEFSAASLESKLVPGLFACGEVLDIDAPCGGFNLQWAWSSGRLAGRLGK